MFMVCNGNWITKSYHTQQFSESFLTHLMHSSNPLGGIDLAKNHKKEGEGVEKLKDRKGFCRKGGMLFV